MGTWTGGSGDLEKTALSCRVLCGENRDHCKERMGLIFTGWYVEARVTEEKNGVEMQEKGKPRHQSVNLKGPRLDQTVTKRPSSPVYFCLMSLRTLCTRGSNMLMLY